jgi:hypothetical protein
MLAIASNRLVAARLTLRASPGDREAAERLLRVVNHFDGAYDSPMTAGRLSEIIDGLDGIRFYLALPDRRQADRS